MTDRKTEQLNAARRTVGTMTELAQMRSAERSLILRDKEINRIVQRRLETGEWVIGSEGFLKAPWSLSTDENGDKIK